MIPLKYNTASQEIPLGYFLDDTDGKTSETGLTIANTDIKLWKSGATTLANKNSGGATHISTGIYYAVLDATDTDTYGPMKIFVQVAGALPVILECLVMEANAYDAMYAALGTGSVEADVTSVSGDSGAADNLEADYDGTGYNKSNSTIGTTTANTDMVAAAPTAAANADAVLDEALSGHVGAGTLGKAIADIETDATAIVADTDELQTNQGNWLTATGFSTHDAAAVWAVATRILTAGTNLNDISTADVAAELATYDGPTKAELDSGLAALNDPTVAAIADQVWDEILSGHLGAGSTGEALNAAGAAGDPWVTALPGAYGGGSAGNIVGNLNDLSSSDVATELATYDGPTKAELDSGLAALNDLTAAQVNAEVDTALADYDAPTKAELDSGLAALNDPTSAAIADAVLDEALSGHVGAGTLGKAVADIETDATAILGDTGELQTNQGNWLTATGFSTHDAAAVWAVATRVLTAGTNLNDLSAAEINAELDTAFTTIMADSVPAKGTIPTREQALYMIVQFLLERSTASTTVTVKKVDGSTTLMTLELDDATTPTSISRAT
jgi:DNA-binding transcriptional ArsR family regulator